MTCTVCHCGKQGEDESHGNGASPVEKVLKSVTCTAHMSRVPRRSYGRMKGVVMTVEDEKTRTGLHVVVLF